jgi:hypothetical protein
MKNTKKIVSGLLGAAMVAVLLGSALAATYARRDPNGQVLAWNDVGMSVARIEHDATVTLLASGGGVLFGVCAGSTGTIATDVYAIAFDSAAVANLTVSSKGKRISPPVYSALATTTMQSVSNSGCWFPPVPIHFSNGIVGATSAGSISAEYYYRLYSSVNP